MKEKQARGKLYLKAPERNKRNKQASEMFPGKCEVKMQDEKQAKILLGIWLKGLKIIFEEFCLVSIVS